MRKNNYTSYICFLILISLLSLLPFATYAESKESYADRVLTIKKESEYGKSIVMQSSHNNVPTDKSFIVEFTKKPDVLNASEYISVYIEDEDGNMSLQAMIITELSGSNKIKLTNLRGFPPNTKGFLQFKKGMPSKDGQDVLYKDTYLFFTVGSRTSFNDDSTPMM